MSTFRFDWPHSYKMWFRTICMKLKSVVLIISHSKTFHKILLLFSKFLIIFFFTWLILLFLLMNMQVKTKFTICMFMFFKAEKILISLIFPYFLYSGHWTKLQWEIPENKSNTVYMVYFCSVHCIFYSVHGIFYILQCTWYILQCKYNIYGVHGLFYSVNGISWYILQWT